MKKIIGLVGRARHGKDTIADYIIAYTNGLYKRVRLAQSIKDATKCLYGFTHEQIESDLKEVIDKKWNITPRNAMLFITKTFINEMGVDFFTKSLYMKYDNNEFGDYIIIPDVRYPHDIEEIRKRDGIIIKVIRNDVNLPRHSVEDIIDEFKADYIIENNGTKDDLYLKIDAILK